VFTHARVHDNIYPVDVYRSRPVGASSAGMPGPEEPAYRGWLGVVTGNGYPLNKILHIPIIAGSQQQQLRDTGAI